MFRIKQIAMVGILGLALVLATAVYTQSAAAAVRNTGDVPIYDAAVNGGGSANGQNSQGNQDGNSQGNGASSGTPNGQIATQPGFFK